PYSKNVSFCLVSHYCRLFCQTSRISLGLLQAAFLLIRAIYSISFSFLYSDTAKTTMYEVHMVDAIDINIYIKLLLNMLTTIMIVDIRKIAKDKSTHFSITPPVNYPQ